jgi:hypothetical protein
MCDFLESVSKVPGICLNHEQWFERRPLEVRQIHNVIGG